MTQDGVPTTPQVAYSVEKFGQVFDIGRSTVYEEIRAGRLKARKAGARTLIMHEDGVAWLNALPIRSVDRATDIPCFPESAQNVFRRTKGRAAVSGTRLPSRRSERDGEGKRETVAETPRKTDAVSPGG
jgi:hypothetical protein